MVLRRDAKEFCTLQFKKKKAEREEFKLYVLKVVYKMSVEPLIAMHTLKGHSVKLA